MRARAPAIGGSGVCRAALAVPACGNDQTLERRADLAIIVPII
jgi:hypothetical protein